MQNINTVWHYTVGDCFADIWRDGLLKPATAFLPRHERPVLWFTLGEDWEPTANKGFFVNGKSETLSTEETAQRFGGLVRVGVSRASAPLDWPAIRKTSGMSAAIADSLARIAISAGSDLSQWRGTYRAVPRDKWIAAEEFKNGIWIPLAYGLDAPRTVHNTAKIFSAGQH